MHDNGEKMKKIERVLFIASDNNNASGAFLSMIKLITLLRDKYGIEVLVVLPYKGSGQELLKKYNISYVIIRSYPWIIPLKSSISQRIKIWPKRAINLFAIFQICKIIKLFNPGLVHINTSWSYVGAIAAYKMKTKVVWHIREYLEEDRSVKIWNRNKGYRIINKADAIITISKDLFGKYHKIFDLSKLHMIYNGIDINRFYKPKREIFGRERYYFSCVGGLYKEKDQDLLIRACKKVADKGVSNFELHIVGEGPEKNKLERRVDELGLQNNVFFDGFISEPEKVYEKTDIALMVSRSEAFGRVTIEAMLSGALVIGSNSGATKELIDNNTYGYLYEAGNEDDLANSIIQAIQQRLKSQTKASNARERAYTFFSAEHNAEEIYNVYNVL